MSLPIWLRTAKVIASQNSKPSFDKSNTSNSSISEPADYSDFFLHYINITFFVKILSARFVFCAGATVYCKKSQTLNSDLIAFVFAKYYSSDRQDKRDSVSYAM